MSVLKLFIFFLVSISVVDASSNYYFYDINEEHTIESIENIDFIAFENVINEGLKSGVYWLKISPSSENNSIIQIENNHIKNIIAFTNGSVIEPILSNSYLSYKIGKNGFPAVLKINVDKEAFIPIEQFTEQDFFYKQSFEALLLGLFYGFVVMVIIVNLFYYFNFYDLSFLYYSFFLFSIAVGMSLTDGLMELIGVSYDWIKMYELFLYSIVGLTAAVFAIDYLQLKNNYPQMRHTLYFAVIISFVLDVVYVYSNDFIYAVFSYLSIFYVFIACWILSLILFKRYSYAAFFCVAYFLLIVFVMVYFLFPVFGLPNFGVDMNVLKIGGYFEMLIITYAVVLRMHFLQSENNRMHDEIILFTQKIKKLSNQAVKKTSIDINDFAQFDLSKKESEVLNLMVQNKGNKEIAADLFISVNTVKFHIKNIYRKLKIQNRKQIRTTVKAI